MRTLMLVASCCLLAACGRSSRIDVDIPAPGPAVMRPCDGLTGDPGRALTQAEVEILWGRDRRAARACNEKHAALVDWVRTHIETFQDH